MLVERGMELLDKLFFVHGTVQTVLVLAITIAFGILLGRIKILSVSFGIGGILFSGIILGNFGFSLDPQLLVFIREFGLILFVYAIGIAVGPTFLESLRDQGLKLNIMAVYIVLCGALLAVACFYIFGLSVPQTAGLFSGSVTNTPSMGSANEAWTQVAGSKEAVSEGLRVIGMAYAIAYPFGIFGIILTMMLLKGMFHINVERELEEIRAKHPHHHFAPRDRDVKTLEVTKSAASGKNLAELLPPGCEVLALSRQGNEYAWNGLWKLRLEDKIILAADSPGLEELAKRLGNKPASLAHPQMLSIFVGIFLGVLCGSIPVMVPGLPTGLRLGVAGGTLVIAIILSRIQHFWGLTWYMSQGALNLMRELGILLFMACVGLYAGTGFVDTLIHGSGLKWMGIGAIITFVPLFTAALFCRSCWNINFPSICGMLAGSMTDPPALAFSIQYYGGDIPAAAYSTVYPLTMILRILIGQLLVLGLVLL